MLNLSLVVICLAITEGRRLQSPPHWWFGRHLEDKHAVWSKVQADSKKDSRSLKRHASNLQSSNSNPSVALISTSHRVIRPTDIHAIRRFVRKEFLRKRAVHSKKGGSRICPEGVGFRTGGRHESPILPSAAFPHNWTVDSPQMVDWAKGYPDVATERPDTIELEVVGQIPSNLRGVLFKNGPGRLSRGGHRYAFEFDGDGMVSRFEIDGGKVSFRSRFVRTREYEEEERAGKLLYRNTFGTQPPGGWRSNAFNVMQRNVANTNVLKWGGKLLTFWEAAQPHCLDEETLETLGLETLDGMLQPGMPFTTGFHLIDKLAAGIVGDPLSSHPKIDEDKNRLVTYGYRVKVSLTDMLQGGNLINSEITVYEFDPRWKVLVRRPLQMQGFAFVHDFVVTENYYIFFQNPVDFEILPYLVGEKNPAELIKYVGSASRPSLVHVVPRNPDEERLTLEMPACFTFHHTRGFERRGQIVVDSVVLPAYPDFASLTSPPNDVDNHGLRTRVFSNIPDHGLERITIDLHKGEVKREKPRGRSVEFPTAGNVPNSKAGHRYVYAACSSHSIENAPFQGVCRINMETGEEVVHFPGPRMFVTEPIFVDMDVPESKEDDGWLLVLVNDAETERTGLYVYDAAFLEDGPLGIAWLPKGDIIPYGLHGSFVPHKR